MEMDELYWFLEYKPRTETRENIYIMTMVSREPRQIIGHVVSRDKTSRTIQKMVDAAPDAERYCTDGYSGYLDVVFPGKHIFNIHNKNDTFTVEGVNADLRLNRALAVIRDSAKAEMVAPKSNDENGEAAEASAE